MQGQFGNGWLSINQDLKGIKDNNGEYDQKGILRLTYWEFGILRQGFVLLTMRFFEQIRKRHKIQSHIAYILSSKNILIIQESEDHF